MAGAIGVAAALLLRSVKVTCPHCGFVQRVERKRVAVRTCARCRGQFDDPVVPIPARR
jgi:ribosomal protein L37AE/L43A